jgi:hypothetical protein
MVAIMNDLIRRNLLAAYALGIPVAGALGAALAVIVKQLGQ